MMQSTIVSKTPRGEPDIEYLDKLHKKKDEYEQKRQDRIQKEIAENSFQPKTTKNKNYQITQNVIERNQEFIAKRNEKREKMKIEQHESLTFTPQLLTNAKSVKNMKSPHHTSQIMMFNNTSTLLEKH